MNSLSDFSDRLLTLNDGQSGLRATLHTEIREPLASDPSTPDPRNSPRLDFISSDESLDRYNEVISAAGWQLHNYRRNPVFQNAHQTGDILHTIGKALITEVRSVSPSTPDTRPAAFLFQRIEFACDVNPMARIAYGLYRGKFLSAVSVGFVPLRWENGTEKSGYSRKFVEQELLEVSAVAIPANPHALALGLKSGAVEKSDLRDTFDLLRAYCETPPADAVSAKSNLNRRRSEVPSPGGPRSAERSQDLGNPSSGGVGNSLGKGEGELSLIKNPTSTQYLFATLKAITAILKS